jgi:hypothetical protein
MIARVPALICIVVFTAGAALAQTNRVDVATPLAPELAPYGKAVRDAAPLATDAPFPLVIVR